MPFRLDTTYLHLLEREVRPVPVGDDFWARIEERTDLHAGRMLMRFSFTRDWPTWEVHPAGDEVVVLLSGEMTLLLEGGEAIPMAAGDAVVVPRGTWHTADVPSRAEALFVTPGEGTENRPR